MNTLIVRDKLDKSDIIFNDSYFEYKLDEYIERGYEYVIKDAIENIDGCIYIGNYKIKSKFTKLPISITEISTGCKTVINVLCNRDKIVNVDGCGLNALEYLLRYGVTVSSRGFLPIKKLDSPIKVVLNTEEVIFNNIVDYHKYWSDYCEKFKY